MHNHPQSVSISDEDAVLRTTPPSYYFRWNNNIKKIIHHLLMSVKEKRYLKHVR